jgi:hypothetical protein
MSTGTYEQAYDQHALRLVQDSLFYHKTTLLKLLPQNIETTDTRACR